MFVGHFAAGLAMRGRAPTVPIWAYIGGAFALDLLWIAFGVTGVDLTPWSDWSHSLAMAALWATVFAAMFLGLGRAAIISLWLIVFSHFVLDLLIQGATLYPLAPGAPQIPILLTAHAWLVQRLLAGSLLLIFVHDEWQVGTLSWRTLAACAVVAALSFR